MTAAGKVVAAATHVVTLQHANSPRTPFATLPTRTVAHRHVYLPVAALCVAQALGLVIL